MLRALAVFLNLAVSPLFFLLAAINRDMAAAGAVMPHDGMMGHMGHIDHMMSGSSHLDTSMLASMWLMYALMGVAHLPAWLNLLAGGGGGHHH